MKNLNKKTEFDKHWEAVFQDAEVSPPDSVWSRIDSELSKEEAGYFKRRAFMFKMLAAASITFALGIGIFSLNHYMDNQVDFPIVQSGNPAEPDHELKVTDNTTLAQEKTDQRIRAIEDAKTPIPKMENGPVEGRSNIAEAHLATENNEVSKAGTNHGNIQQTSSSINNNNYEFLPLIEEATGEEALFAGDITEEPKTTFASLSSLEPRGIPYGSEEEVLYEIDHIYLIPFMPRGASKKKHDQNDDTGILMASLDFSAGQFDPNFQQVDNTFKVPNGYVAADTRAEVVPFNATNKKLLSIRRAGQETKPELAYSYGANVGFKLSKRFLLQTGFAYRKANTSTTTTGYIYNPENDSRIPIVASYQYQLEGLSSVQGMDETSLNNQYEFASIPVRAGYVVLNKKINVTLLAGISSEIFINNSISDDSNFLESLSSDDASDSPYNNMFFNGSLGTMVGYSFAKNYMVTLEPSYRMAINSFTKDSFYLSSYPSSFMLSFGVAYNFR